MQLKPRTRLIIGLLCLLTLAAVWGWLQRQPATSFSADATPPGRADTAPIAAGAPAAPSPFNGLRPGAAQPTPAAVPATATNEPFAYRLRNTPRTLEDLMRDDAAVLLRNALIDARQPLNLAIPAHLRAAAEPGAYIVQARAALNDGFRQQLTDAGATVVAYVPNNAWLVRVSANGAERLAALPQTQSVQPWEPYYKLDPRLLAAAVEQRLLPTRAGFNVLVFPGDREAAAQSLAALGAQIAAEDRSPFGTQLTLYAPETALVPMAKLPTVQAIEPLSHRQPANDLTRARVKVAANTVTPESYRGLTGTGVRVGVNDTGVDAAHPDLSPRVSALFAGSLDDPQGHGTHVAGIIASSGQNGPDGRKVPGSFTNSNYRGMAPEASIYALPIDIFFGALIGDSYLQEQTALTNILISNNSWGYPAENDYNLASASWDEAVRDAIPGVTGPQPLLAVFSAGNSGGGGSDGGGGRANSIVSPGTAKNVITVGAIENYRRITNDVTINQITEPIFLGSTDSSNQVAGFSSRGNVGRGIEGPYGRFKPDLVAPGVMVVSTRSSQWQDPSGDRSVELNNVRDQTLPGRSTNNHVIFVPNNAVQLIIEVRTNRFSPIPFPDIPIFAAANQFPGPGDLVGTTIATIDNPAAGDWFYSLVNPNTTAVRYDLRTILIVTNDTGDYYAVLKELNDVLAPHYRYESGSSQSAAVISGLLALMQQHFEQTLGRTNSPALMKALLINGARTASTTDPSYDFAVRNYLNYQGWGLPNITNTLPAGLATGDGANGANGAMVYFDQDASRALATGQSFTRNVTVGPGGINSPLRFTLVWTDPPGNPAVGIKLVNDLDLIVTNLTTGAVFVGNGIESGNVFSTAVESNTVPDFDLVNNVENVFLDRPLSGATYSVTVRARRVNVNAVNIQTNGTQQDFALVVSSGNPAASLQVTVGAPVAGWDGNSWVKTAINGSAMLNERVGANYPLLASTNGITNQWNFYIVTNRIEGTNAGLIASNIAFATFLPPNLSRSRYFSADIDLYVSTDSNLTNLDTAVIASSWRSVKRGGTEMVVIPNATPDLLYYAAVKSEDHQGASYGFFAVSSQAPFSSEDEDGNITFQGYPIGAFIPDGDAEEPGGTNIIAFCTESAKIQNVTVENTLTMFDTGPGQELGGDLFGVLSHTDPETQTEPFVVLNNHRAFWGSPTWIYDESDDGEIPNAIPPDGPGSLRDFAGDEAQGVWQFTITDNSLDYTGRVDSIEITVTPEPEELINGDGITVTILPGRWKRYTVDIPPNATNLMVCVSPDAGPVDVYLRYASDPTLTQYDLFQRIQPPGDCVNLGRRDSPPLTTGRYFLGLFNPGNTPLVVNIKVFVQRGAVANSTFNFRASGAVNILDDAVTNSTIFVNQAREVADISVGVRIDHERVSDLVLHLISPSGTRVMLAENRGGPNGTNYGAGFLNTNVVPVSSSGGAAAHTNIINVPTGEGNLEVSYDFYGIPDFMTVYYDGQLIFDSGVVSGQGTFSVDFGPGRSTNLVVVMNEGDNSNLGTAWNYTATIVSGVLYATFTENTNFAKVPIKFAVPPFTVPNFGVTNTIGTNVGTILEDGFDTAPGGANPKVLGTIFSGWQVTQPDIDVVYVGYGLCVPSHSPPNGVDLNGESDGAISTNLTTIPGQSYLLSFSYTKNPDASVFGPRSAEVSLSGATNFTITADPPGSTCANPVWIPTSIVFTATAPQTTLSLRSLNPGNGGVFVDSFKITGVTNSTTSITYGLYYLAEESLSPFIGEGARGNWRLEIWDNRVGGAISNSTLLSWKLNLNLANTNFPVIPLTNCVEFAGAAPDDNTEYFYVNVPLSANFATNTLRASNSLDLLFGQFGLPQGNRPGDYPLLDNVTDGVAVIATNGTTILDSTGTTIASLNNPRLVPGRRYYLGVRNDSGIDAVPFNLRVCFDREDPNLPAIRQMTNGGTICTNIAATTMEYYFFNVASNAISVTYEILPFPNGNVDLFVTKGLPVPSTNFFYTNSILPGTNPEFINITDYDFQLLPGRWYMGVYNNESRITDYCIHVQQVTGIVINLPASFARNSLMASALTNTIGPNGIIYYRAEILNNAWKADFILTNLSGNADLYIRPQAAGPLLPAGAAPTNAWYSGINGATNPELLVVSNSAAVHPLSPGTWLMAVTNNASVPVTYVVKVNQYTNSIPTYIDLTNFVARSDTFSGTNQIDYFQFVVLSNPVQVVFDTYFANRNVDLFVKPAPNYPPPGPTNFLFASTNAGLVNEYLVITNSAPTNLLKPGIWYLAVTNLSGAPANYTIRARAYYESNFVTLASGIGHSTTLAASNSPTTFGFNYYRFDVSSNAFQARFETFGTTNNLTLLVQKGLPLTNENAFTYRTNLPLSGDRIINVMTNSAPVPLGPGTWYMAVFNPNPFAVPYTARVTEIMADQIVRLTNAVAYSNTIAPQLTTRLSGIDYYVFTVSTGAFQTTFETTNATGNVDLYVSKGLPIPGISGFPFASTNLGTTNEMILVLPGSTPALTPGDWYLAVVNRDPTNVSYSVRATEFTPNSMVTLTNAVSYEQDTIAPGPTTEFYRFVVSTNAIQANFQLDALTGQADLYLRKGPPLTNVLSWPLFSTNLAASDEWIVVNPGLGPVPLTAGEWYLAVVNLEAGSLHYRVTASEALSNQVIRLTPNAAPVSATVASASPVFTLGRDFYVFNVSTSAVQVDCLLHSFGANVDLFVSRSLPLPATPDGDYRSTNGAPDEWIQVGTNSTPVALASGEWYLTVLNRELAPSPYEVRIVELDQLRIARLTNNTVATGIVGVSNPASPYSGIDFYVFNVPSNAVQATFETLEQSGNVDLYVSSRLPLPGPTNHFFASTNPLSTLEWIAVSTNSTPPLIPGDWFVAVVNRETAPVTYKLRATAVLASQIVRLTNGVAFSNLVSVASNAPVGGANYYVFDVSTNAGRVQFEVLQPSGEVFLAVKKNLPVPDAVHHAYFSDNWGANPEFIAVNGSSSPVPLSPGQWYLTVGRLTGGSATYQVKATEYSSAGTNLLITQALMVTNQLCLTWTNSLPGVPYHVQGRISLDNTNWMPVSPTLTAVATEMNWCLPLPSQFRFFQIAEGLVIPPVAPPQLPIDNITMTNGVFRFQWTGPTNQTYRAEWTSTLVPGSWLPIPGLIASANGVFVFIDDGSQTGGLGPKRFYRFILLP